MALSWKEIADMDRKHDLREALEQPAYKFDPKRQISDLEARLLRASNAMHNHPTDGTPAAEPFTSKHAVRKP